MTLAVILLIECGCLIFVDKSYLSENTNSLKVEKVDENTEKIDPELKVSLTGSEKDLKVSFDGKYIAYSKNDNLYVLSMINGQTYSIPMDKNRQLNFYQWVYDSNKLIIAEKEDKSYGNSVKLYRLDTKTLQTTTEPLEIRDTVHNKDAEIRLPSSSYDISAIDFSTYTVATFLKLSKSDSYSKLWKFNLPEENYMYSKLSPTNIGKIQCLKNKTELLYENLDNSTVNITGTGTITVNGEKKLQLAGFDKNDNVYFAKGDSETTSEIYYGSLVETDKSGNPEITTKPKLQSLILDKPVSIDGITVTIKGNIYSNDSSNEIFTDLKTKKQTTYEGKVIGVYTTGFYTVDSDNVLKANVFA